MFHEIYENLQTSITDATVELWEHVLRNERAEHTRNIQLKKLQQKMVERNTEKRMHEKDYKEAFSFLNQQAVTKKSR